MDQKKSVTIMLVEDDDLVRETLALSLEKDGYRVIQDADGLHAIEEAARVKPRLILLDIRLPQTDGVTLLGKLKQHPFVESIPVVMLTNLTDQRLVSECVQRGARGYFVKSELSYSEVARKVREIIGSEPESE